jgi:hypothetical protein
VARLRRLAPPDVSKAEYDAQLTSLRGMGTSAGRLAQALAAGSLGNAAPLLLAFDRSAVATRARSVLRAQRAAIRSFDSRSADLAALGQAISEGRLRLSNAVS